MQDPKFFSTGFERPLVRAHGMSCDQVEERTKDQATTTTCSYINCTLLISVSSSLQNPFAIRTQD